MSSKEAGTATLSVKPEDLEITSITLAFIDKKRYCIHCDVKIPFASKDCPECGKNPPAGLDTKACRKCKTVIPVIS